MNNNRTIKFFIALTCAGLIAQSAVANQYKTVEPQYYSHNYYDPAGGEYFNGYEDDYLVGGTVSSTGRVAGRAVEGTGRAAGTIVGGEDTVTGRAVQNTGAVADDVIEETGDLTGGVLGGFWGGDREGRRERVALPRPSGRFPRAHAPVRQG